MSTILEGTRILLRKPSKRDIEAVYTLASHKSISAFTHVPYPYMEHHAVGFVTHAQRGWKQGTSFPFVVVLKETNEVIGSVGFVKVYDTHIRAEVGYWLGVPFRGHGYMAEALELLLAYGFKTRKFKRIEAKAFTENIPSVKLLKKMGFTVEGTLRKTEKRRGKYLDEYVCSILQEEYKK